jgi:hypothetical protein
MSGFIAATDNPLSRMTVASLADIGYQVDLDAAEPYQLPDLAALAEEGELLARVASVDYAAVLPVIPRILPADSV